jgi:hypothetical protein
MSTIHEESVPLVDARGAASESLHATDRAQQHQNKNGRLRRTLAIGATCALLAGAAVALAVERPKRGDASNAAALGEGGAAALGGEFYDFKMNDDGGMSCLPAMSNEYPNAISGDTDPAHGIEHKITPRDCAWYKKLHPFAQQRAAMPSSCAPPDTLFVSIADSENYDIAKLSTQRVQDQSCFMNRYILITLDAEATRKCESEKLFHCLQYADGHAFDGLTHTGGHADDVKYRMLTWFKQKVTLGLLAASVNFFMFDTDVLLFKVPDLGLLTRERPNVNVFYQQDWIGYNALYRGRNPYMNVKAEDVAKQPEAWNFNSGQLYWRWSPTTLKIQRLALNHGPATMEQERVQQAINELVAKGEAHAGALPFDGYGSGCADVNTLPNEPSDFVSPEILHHMRSWWTLHCDCILGKSPGMKKIEARLECLARYNDESTCVKIQTNDDWEKMKEERGANLGADEEEGFVEERLSPARVTKSKMQTMLARYECVLANPTASGDCSEITVLASA